MCIMLNVRNVREVEDFTLNHSLGGACRSQPFQTVSEVILIPKHFHDNPFARRKNKLLRLQLPFISC